MGTIARTRLGTTLGKRQDGLVDGSVVSVNFEISVGAMLSTAIGAMLRL